MWNFTTLIHKFAESSLELELRKKIANIDWMEGEERVWWEGGGESLWQAAKLSTRRRSWRMLVDQFNSLVRHSLSPLFPPSYWKRAGGMSEGGRLDGAHATERRTSVARRLRRHGVIGAGLRWRRCVTSFKGRNCLVSPRPEMQYEIPQSESWNYDCVRRDGNLSSTKTQNWFMEYENSFTDI